MNAKHPWLMYLIGVIAATGIFYANEYHIHAPLPIALLFSFAAGVLIARAWPD